MKLEIYLKSSTGKSYSNIKNNTEAICEWGPQSWYHILWLMRQPVPRQTSNISRTLVGNESVDHSDVVGAPPVGAAPTTASFST